MAHLAPVGVAGVTVTRATLHNEAMVRGLGARAGDSVYVQRAGDVIPQVIGIAARGPGGSDAPWAMPEACPECPHKVEQEGANHFCTGGWECPPQRLARLTHFVGKGAMEIEARGVELVELLMATGRVRAPGAAGWGGEPAHSAAPPSDLSPRSHPGRRFPCRRPGCGRGR